MTTITGVIYGVDPEENRVSGVWRWPVWVAGAGELPLTGSDPGFLTGSDPGSVSSGENSARRQGRCSKALPASAGR